MSYDFLKKPNGKYKLLAKKKSAIKEKGADEVGKETLADRLADEQHTK